MSSVRGFDGHGFASNWRLIYGCLSTDDFTVHRDLFSWTHDDDLSHVDLMDRDLNFHTVTFDAGPDCGRLSQGATVSRTFSDAGSFAYHCTIHSFMKGTVVVQ